MRFAIIESEVLISAEDGDVLASEALHYLRMGGYTPSITPTIGHELIEAADDRDASAMAVLTQIKTERSQGGIFYPTLNPGGTRSDPISVINGHAGMAAEELCSKDLVDDRNVALIIGEAACIPAEIIVFDSEKVKKMDNKAINKVLVLRDLSPIKIVDPLGIIRLFTRNP